MPKKRENPEQWGPCILTADAACTILQFWSRYCWEIADFRNFRNKKDTVSNYTATLKQIEKALSLCEICKLSVMDIRDAINSVPWRTNSLGERINYSIETVKTRYTVIHDIYLFAEAKTIWPNILYGIPWQLLVEGADSHGNLIPKKFKDLSQRNNKILPRYLSKRQEQKIMRAAVDHIEEDGRWIALALLLWDGPRPSEIRRSYFSDLKQFNDDPSRRHLRLCRSSESDGQEKAEMKNRFGPRSIPEHEELQHIINLREDFVRHGVDQDIPPLPLICYKNDFHRACTAQELSVFVQFQLRKLFGPEYFTELLWLSGLDTPPAQDELDGDPPDPDNAVELAADMELSARLSRRNFATKNYSETRLADWQSRKTMGHQSETPVSFAYSEGHLREMLNLMSHRMILPELHSGWHTVYHPELNCVEKSDVGVHYVSIPHSNLAQIDSITLEITLDRPGDDFSLEFYRRIPPECLSVDMTHATLSPGKHLGRVNTDAEHWPLTWEIARKDLDKKIKE